MVKYTRCLWRIQSCPLALLLRSAPAMTTRATAPPPPPPPAHCSTTLQLALHAYLDPLLAQHARGKLIEYPDLPASWKAADQVLQNNATDNDIQYVSQLHQSQLAAYQAAALDALRSFARTMPLPAILDDDASSSSSGTYVTRCLQHATNTKPNWHLANTADLENKVLSIVKSRAALAYEQREASRNAAVAAAAAAAVTTLKSPPPKALSPVNEALTENNEDEEEEEEEEGEVADNGDNVDEDDVEFGMAEDGDEEGEEEDEAEGEEGGEEQDDEEDEGELSEVIEIGDTDDDEGHQDTTGPPAATAASTNKAKPKRKKGLLAKKKLKKQQQQASNKASTANAVVLPIKKGNTLVKPTKRSRARRPNRGGKA